MARLNNINVMNKPVSTSESQDDKRERIESADFGNQHRGTAVFPNSDINIDEDILNDSKIIKA